MDSLQKLSYKNVDITDGFWAERQKMNRDTTIYAVRDRFEDTGRFRAFDFSYKAGDENEPHFFWDSDIAKWLESVAYIIEKEPNEALQAKLEQVVDQIEAHQEANGYFNIYHTVVAPELRFQNYDHHELYCLGHLLEAAVAYYEATGRDRFLNLMGKYVDLVIQVFMEEKSANFTVPGHEEIELALYRTYELTGDEKYLKLANFFIDQRGTQAGRKNNRVPAEYNQNHLPVREQKEAFGHAVRACYLYAGMADAARIRGDQSLLDACKALFEDISRQKMYITGGVGSTHIGEAFTIPFDLPNDTAYAETCAAIALAMFANRMKDIDVDAKYADIVEKALYNGVISGISLDGKSFFYENPLEINLKDRTRHTSRIEKERLPITQRLEVFGCSCCPPNMTRFIASLGDYIFSYDSNRIFIHQFMSCTANVCGAQIKMETRYPNSGDIAVHVDGAKGKIVLIRIPGWCDSFSLNRPHEMLNGYAAVRVDADAEDFTLSLHMRPVLMTADPRVRATAGRAAVMYGPIVYCAEAKDNDVVLSDVRLDPMAAIQVSYSSYFNAPALSCEASVADTTDVNALYAPFYSAKRKTVSLQLIPYFGFANRGESDMRVWLRV